MKKVLLIEDDPIAVMLCKKVIEKSSWTSEVDTVSDGGEAIAYYESLIGKSDEEELEKYPRLILLDLNMPVIGGWEFLDEFILNFYPICSETKVVILSSSIVPEDQIKAGQYPLVLDFLSKPIRVKDLEKVSKLFDENEVNKKTQ